MTHHTGWY